ncbi:reverse transcriptase [Gossypium australe]|uniref:Reverse transcriptase n=1 Tax=Gossypium australe TaxID=47621 RepID=A0A5B6WQ65_9ROSI|nr:reverse transcriptase [Gossypium australe]
MSKTYNRVKCLSLRAIMLRMGFHISWVKTIMKCITTVSYSIIVNGKVGEIFRPTRGFRQGFSTFMRLALRDCLIKGAKANRRAP